jgi:hypothetical protein
MVCERTLPVLPLTGGGELWDPKPTTKRALMERLNAELDRRAQVVPVIPEEQPEPTSGALRRLERVRRLMPARAAANHAKTPDRAE